uniref:G protein gamma domain-containing protein n=1 Tax=Suricata suricatta TaxID=37032 RepID=A0A673TLY4_SURSU
MSGPSLVVALKPAVQPLPWRQGCNPVRCPQAAAGVEQLCLHRVQHNAPLTRGTSSRNPFRRPRVCSFCRKTNVWMVF